MAIFLLVLGRDRFSRGSKGGTHPLTSPKSSLIPTNFLDIHIILENLQYIKKIVKIWKPCKPNNSCTLNFLQDQALILRKIITWICFPNQSQDKYEHPCTDITMPTCNPCTPEKNLEGANFMSYTYFGVWIISYRFHN